MTQNNLGAAYGNRIQGSRRRTSKPPSGPMRQHWPFTPATPSRKGWAWPERSGSACKTASRAAGRRISKPRSRPMKRPRPSAPAEAFPKLGHDPEQSRHCLSRPHPGQPAENIDAAIKALDGGLDRLYREAFPLDWAAAQTNLGTAYHDRIRGNRAENREAEIEAIEAALTVRTRQALPETGEGPEQSRHRLFATYPWSRAENLEAAIKALEAALTIPRPRRLPAILGHGPAQSRHRLFTTYPSAAGPRRTSELRSRPMRRL